MALRDIVAGQIRILRKQAGLTQAELSERTGINVRHLSQMENAGLNLTLDTIERVAQGLEAPVSKLVSDADAKKRPPKKELSGVEAAIRVLKGYRARIEE